MDKVVLVNKDDETTGSMEKMEAHRQGLLHRAFSIFIFNAKGDLLLQKRANGKYHSAGLWTNTCCGHPGSGEDIILAAHRRLYEEMGMGSTLNFGFRFTYNTSVGNDMTENEVDHLFFGLSDSVPVPAPEEVSAWKYSSPEVIRKELAAHPEQFTAWFKLMFEEAMAFYASAQQAANAINEKLK